MGKEVLHKMTLTELRRELGQDQQEETREQSKIEVRCKAGHQENA